MTELGLYSAQRSRIPLQIPLLRHRGPPPWCWGCGWALPATGAARGRESERASEWPSGPAPGPGPGPLAPPAAGRPRRGAGHGHTRPGEAGRYRGRYREPIPGGSRPQPSPALTRRRPHHLPVARRRVNTRSREHCGPHHLSPRGGTRAAPPQPARGGRSGRATSGHSTSARRCPPGPGEARGVSAAMAPVLGSRYRRREPGGARRAGGTPLCPSFAEAAPPEEVAGLPRVTRVGWAGPPDGHAPGRSGGPAQGPVGARGSPVRVPPGAGSGRPAAGAAGSFPGLVVAGKSGGAARGALSGTAGSVRLGRGRTRGCGGRQRLSQPTRVHEPGARHSRDCHTGSGPRSPVLPPGAASMFVSRSLSSLPPLPPALPGGAGGGRGAAGALGAPGARCGAGSEK